MSRVIVIGLDGGTLSVIRKVAEDFELPNLAKVLREGSSGILESVIPYISPTNWISMVTGTNPGKHGIYDFLRLTKEKSLKPICFNDCRAKALWHTLSEQEKKVVVANIPVTYPASKVNGIFISGPFAPKISTFPKEWERKLPALGYKQEMLGFEAKSEKLKKESLLKRLLSIEKSRKVVFTKLLKEEQWDFYMVVFTFPDRFQNFGLDDTANFLHFYQIIDALLGDIMEELNSDDLLMIVSDHGFGSVNKCVLINRWLISKGLLVLKGSMLEKILRAVGLTKELVQSNRLITNTFSRLSRYMLSLHSIALKLLEFIPSEKFSFDLRRVDFEKSKAFAYGSPPLSFINIVSQDSKQRKELFKLIKDSLLSMKDPASGEKCIKNIYNPQDIYDGPCTKFAPDMIIEPGRGCVLDSRYVGTGEVVTEVARAIKADHAREGVLLAYGANIKAANNVRAKIVDIAPTILHYMGLPVSADMDGKFLRGMFHEDSEPARREVIYKRVEEEEETGPREELTRQDEDKVKKKLRDLGYL